MQVTDQPERRQRVRRRSDRRRTWPFVLIVAVSFTVLAVAFHDLNDVRNLSRGNRTLISRLGADERELAAVQGAQARAGATHRKQIAASDLKLCTKLYGQIVTLEKTSAAQATVAIYHHLLPSIPLPEIRALVKNAHQGAKRVEKQFDPAQCHQLPSQKIVKAPKQPAK